MIYDVPAYIKLASFDGIDWMWYSSHHFSKRESIVVPDEATWLQFKQFYDL